MIALKTTMPKFCATCSIGFGKKKISIMKKCFHQLMHRFCGKEFSKLARILLYVLLRNKKVIL